MRVRIPPPRLIVPLSHTFDMRSWTDDDLISAIACCESMAATARHLGLCPTGNSYQTLRHYVRKLRIDTSHFSPPRRIRLTYEMIFCENSLCRGSKLAKYVLRHSLLSYVCSECGNTGIHNGKPLRLQIDHINGVHNDNRVGNLRFLCPNCHTQTPTYARAKSKIGKAPSDTKPAEYRTLNCSYCLRDFQRLASKVRYLNQTTGPFYCGSSCLKAKNSMSLDRKTAILSEYNETKSYRATGKKFGISDVAVRKLVKRHIRSV